jgi:hypothetical protein
VRTHRRELALAAAIPVDDHSLRLRTIASVFEVVDTAIHDVFNEVDLLLTTSILVEKVADEVER